MTHAADGGITFRAAGSRNAPAETRQMAPPDTRLNELAARLAATGWQVGHSADGSITFAAAEQPATHAQAAAVDGILGAGFLPHYGRADADDRGHFRVMGLAEGEYKLNALPPANRWAPIAGG